MDIEAKESIRRTQTRNWLNMITALALAFVCVFVGYHELRAGSTTAAVISACGATLMLVLTAVMGWVGWNLRKILKELEAYEQQEIENLMLDFEQEFEKQWQIHIEKNDHIKGIRTADRPR